MQNLAKMTSSILNCISGRSRSATFVIAYLMIKQEMNANEALNHVLKKRPIRPNDGFLKQISRLDNNLRKKNINLTI